MNRNGGRTGLRLIAVVLIGSGVLLMGLFLWLLIEAAKLAALQVLLYSWVLAVPVWSIWTGFGLWKLEPWAYKSAIALFIAEMPVIAVPGFLYQFYTGMNLAVLSATTDVKLVFRFDVGAAFRLQFPPELQSFVVGLNVIPILMLIYMKKCQRLVENPPLPEISPTSPDTSPPPSVSPG
ncbi:MAG TPA: hypothetical protein VI685_04820 [Candidatus Angelobacter sp.]